MSSTRTKVNSAGESTLSRRHFGRLAVGSAIALALVGTQAIPAEAYTASVNVRWGGYCSVGYNILTNGGFSGGVRFNLGSHGNAYVTLSTSNSWGWARDARGLNLPWAWKNQYHVQFLNSAGQNVWTEYNSIPNGGSRRYYVGSNVTAIVVAAGPGPNAYGYYMSPVVGAQVGYTSA